MSNKSSEVRETKTLLTWNKTKTCNLLWASTFHIIIIIIIIEQIGRLYNGMIMMWDGKMPTSKENVESRDIPASNKYHTTNLAFSLSKNFGKKKNKQETFENIVFCVMEMKAT